ncbi:MAG: hypothetical protein OXF75_03425 [Acidimicrobiaceae bacterium]|nr:hypothetical protein [Acidimicrobiaceae bacterium]
MRIDEQLASCGWVVQDYKHAAIAAARGVAVREVPTEAGPADYVLYVDGQAVDVIEAKKAGSTLTGVEPQTAKHQAAYSDELPAFFVDDALPFGYESTGSETRFTCGLDPVAASRRVYSFHRPETLARWQEDFINGRGAAVRMKSAGASEGRRYPWQFAAHQTPNVLRQPVAAPRSTNVTSNLR